MKNSIIILLLFFLAYGDEQDITIWREADYSIVGKLDVENDTLAIYYDVTLFKGKTLIYKDNLDIQKNKLHKAKVRLHALGKNIVVQYEVDDRPLKSKMRLVYIKNSEFEKAELLPNFFDTLSVINFDKKTFSGFLNYSEAYCFECDTVFYNPKLVYNISIEDSKIDTVRTKNVNSELYGNFYGFEYNTNIKLKRAYNKRM